MHLYTPKCQQQDQNQILHYPQLEKVKASLSVFEEISNVNLKIDYSQSQIKTLEQSETEIKKVISFLTLKNKLVLAEKVNAENEKLQSLISEFEVSKNQYINALSSFLDNQAGILAQKLTDNTPCCVCGSLTHPNKATLGENVFTQSQVDALKETQEILSSKVQQQKAVVVLSQKELEAAFNGEVPKDFGPLKEEYNKIKSQIPLNAELSSYKDNLIECTKNLEIAKETLKNHTEHLTSLNAKISEKFSDEQTVKTLKLNLETELKAIEDQINNYTNLKKELELLLQKQEYTQNELQESHEKYLEIRTKVKNAIFENGFETYDNYRTYVIDEETLKTRYENLSAYDAQTLKLQNTFEILNQSVGGKSEIDIPKLTQILEELTEKAKELFGIIRLKQTALETYSQTKQTLMQILALSLQKEEEYQNITLLYKAAKGDNTQRVDFERYVLSTYFDDILVSANNRFLKMTNGRYQMKRKRDKGKGRSAEGLDIEILDASTGQNRAVSSLSGGESFKASLSLALGLGDVVQSYSGGIVIDTMFIDEGFGTLDSNSLNSAIECLSELNRSTSRTIGIISHVAELKERIIQKIEVKATQNGSKINIHT